MKKERFAALLMAASVLACGCSVQATGEVNIPQTEAVPDTQEKVTEDIAPMATETEEATEVVEEPVVQTVTVTAVGDCTLGVTQTHGYAGSFHEYYDQNGEDYFFGGVRDLFESDDFTLINLECVLSESENRVEKTWNLKGKPEYVGIMTGSSVEGCSLGNNHTLDYGESSLEDTKSVLDEAGIIYGLNEHVATYTTESGIVIGIVSSNMLWQDETHANYVKDGIAALREQGANLVIVSCHWGIEGDHYANGYQVDMAHQIIDWGADLLIGTHPHVLQGVELYKGKVICYSLGNFCFGGNSNPSDKRTFIYQQRFTFVDGQLQPDIDAGIIPCRVSSVSGYNDYQPTILTGEDKLSVIEAVRQYSQPISSVTLDDDGNLLVLVTCQ